MNKLPDDMILDSTALFAYDWEKQEVRYYTFQQSFSLTEIRITSFEKLLLCLGFSKEQWSETTNVWKKGYCVLQLPTSDAPDNSSCKWDALRKLFDDGYDFVILYFLRMVDESEQHETTI